MKDSDYLRLFGLTTDATRSELKARYKKLCQIVHPDSGGDNELFILINEAYERLKCFESFKNIDADVYDPHNNSEHSDSRKSSTTYHKKSSDSYSFADILSKAGKVKFSYEELAQVLDGVTIVKVINYDNYNFNMQFEEDVFLYERYKNLYLEEPLKLTVYSKRSLFGSYKIICKEELNITQRITSTTEILKSYKLSFPKESYGKIVASFCGIEKQYSISPSAKDVVLNFEIYDRYKMSEINRKRKYPHTSSLDLSAAFKINLLRVSERELKRDHLDNWY